MECFDFKNSREISIFEEGKISGFLKEAGTYPKRRLDVDRLEMTQQGIQIIENADTMSWKHENHYNFGGMAYRISLPEPGIYHLEITTFSSPENTNVLVSGMMPGGEWTRGRWSDFTWSYDYACGNQYLDIELEPKFPTSTEPFFHQIKIGLSEIKVELIEEIKLSKDAKQTKEVPTIFLLGDSTVKTYLFEDAPLSSWGQVFPSFFLKENVQFRNFSQGARSLKTIYQEGRFNTLMLEAKAGDYIFIQSGHNDEARDGIRGIDSRFGRGTTKESYCMYLEDYFLPVIRKKGIHPIFVTCMTMMDFEFYSQDMDFDNIPMKFKGFTEHSAPYVNYPGIMKSVGEKKLVPVIDLYEESKRYLSNIGGNGAKAIFLTIEPGEYPGKTNSGSYANGNPSGGCDLAHYKEALGKQFARIVVTDLVEKQVEPFSYVKEKVKEAVQRKDFSQIYPEVSFDVEKGEGAYYRNQIEKMLEHSILSKRADGGFHPMDIMDTKEFLQAVEKAWEIDIHFESPIPIQEKELLTVWRTMEIFYYGYVQKFERKPPYMTEYNGVELDPSDPNYDSNLVGDKAVYYPLLSWDEIQDKDDFPDEIQKEVKEVYQLGLLRADVGVPRGKMKNGNCLYPKRQVTRGKAAKYLYFIWMLQMPVKMETHKALA